MANTEKELARLSAKVAAIEMILETLIVDALAKTSDPARVGNAMIESAFASEKKVRDEFGDHPSALQVTEALSALIDRAIARAAQQKKRRSR